MDGWRPVITPWPIRNAEMLDKGEYHTEYKEVNSKVIKTGRKETFKLGKKTLKYIDKYKY